MPAGPMSRAGGTAAHADGPRVVAERRGRAQRTGAASADERGGRAGPQLAGARVDGGLRGPACAAREARVRRWVRIWSITDVWVMPATRRSAPWQVGHLSGSIGDVHEDSGEELQRVGGLGARRWPLGLVRPVPHRPRAAVVGEPFQRDRIAGAVPGESGGEGTIVLRDPKGSSQTAVCTWNPECGHVSMAAAWSSSKSAKRTNKRRTARRNASVRSPQELPSQLSAV